MNVFQKVGVGVGATAAVAAPVALGAWVGTKPTSTPITDDRWNEIHDDAARYRDLVQDKPRLAKYVQQPEGAERGDHGVQLRPRSDFEQKTPIWDMTRIIAVPTVGAAIIGGIAPRVPGPGIAVAYGLAGMGIAAGAAGITRAVTD